MSCLTRSTSSFSPSGTKSNSPKSSETPHLPEQRKPAFLRQSLRYLPSLHCWQGFSPRAAQPPLPPSWVRSPPWEPVLLPRRSRNGRHVIYRPPASRKVYGTALWPLTTFVDLNNAFDTVSREGLWKIMSVRQFNEGMQARVLDWVSRQNPSQSPAVSSKVVSLPRHCSAWCSLLCWQM